MSSKEVSQKRGRQNLVALVDVLEQQKPVQVQRLYKEFHAKADLCQFKNYDEYVDASSRYIVQKLYGTA